MWWECPSGSAVTQLLGLIPRNGQVASSSAVTWTCTYNLDLALASVPDTDGEGCLQASVLVLQQDKRLVRALGLATILGGQEDMEGILGAERDWACDRLGRRESGGVPLAEAQLGWLFAWLWLTSPCRPHHPSCWRWTQRHRRSSRMRQPGQHQLPGGGERKHQRTAFCLVVCGTKKEWNVVESKERLTTRLSETRNGLESPMDTVVAKKCTCSWELSRLRGVKGARASWNSRVGDKGPPWSFIPVLTSTFKKVELTIQVICTSHCTATQFKNRSFDGEQNPLHLCVITAAS